MKTNRRQFITTLGLSAAALSAGLPAWAYDKKRIKLEQIGFISGIVSNALRADWKGNLEKISRMGYTEMEMGGYYGESVAEFKSFCKSLNISPFAGGSTLVNMVKDPERQIAKELEMGKEYWVCYWPWQTPDKQIINKDEIKPAVDELNKLGAICKKEGIKFCWHNHALEFENKTDEGMVYDIIMKNTDPDTVKSQLDIYWVYKGGGDAVKVLKKYPGRVDILHVKDMDNTAEKSFACPGSGIIDFRPVFREASDQGVRHYIVEKDNERNGMECLASSANYLKNVRF